MSRFSYPHTIDDGAGERLTFLRRVPGPNGDRLEVENRVAPGCGPIMHVHHYQTEALTVKQGRIAWQRPGQPAQHAGPGATATFGPGDVHKFWNAGEEDLVCTGYIEPADSIEYYLAEMFASRRRNAGVRPSMFDIAYLATRYRSEFGVHEVPEAVQRAVFPVVLLVGRMLGKYERYADAPAPVVR
jgi:quercetin dioxygenase-like cupin family protein